MSIVQLLLIAGGLLALMVMGYVLMTGSSPAKESQRRLQAVRYRHSESTTDKVESQLKKAIAARKPKQFTRAGADSRLAALQLRLDRTGMGWLLAQYFYASLGIAVVLTALLYLKTDAAMLSLGIGLLAGAGLPHMVVGHFIKRRTNQFNAKFPDGIDLLVCLGEAGAHAALAAKHPQSHGMEGTTTLHYLLVLHDTPRAQTRPFQSHSSAPIIIPCTS